MDITAVQAEASTKATAWLTQNLQTSSDAPAEAPVEPTIAVASTTPAATTPPETTVQAKPGLADAIRRDRETRAAAQSTTQEVTKTKSELEQARKEIESLKALGAATDPFEFLKHRRLSKEQQALWGQAFLYDLKPEVAPQEFRLDIYKAEQARKEEERAAAEERNRAEQAQLQGREYLDRYANELVQHVQSSAGSNPESEMWFSEEDQGNPGQLKLNHQVYARSLLATAENLTRTAARMGQQADLSPANVAKVLEAEVSKRMQRRDAKRAGSAQGQTKQVTPVVPAQNGTQANDTTTTSANGLRSGAPLKLDMSDEARRARAAAVLGGTK